MPEPVTPLDHALEYAARGWAVIPLHTTTGKGCSCARLHRCTSPGKHPRTQHGLEDGTTDGDQIRTWWGRWPKANVGIVTGAVSGLIVLDIDADKGGFQSLDDMQAENEQLDDTITVNTGGGGRHLYFAHPGTPIGNRGRMRPGIDFRGDGGYVVAPPSGHQSGRQYEWAIELDEPAPLPAWLETELREREAIPKALPEFVADDWDGRTPDTVLAVIEAGGRLARLFKRDKRLKRDGGDASKVDYELACGLYKAGVSDPLTIAYGLMASRSQDPEAWQKCAQKGAGYFEKTVANAISAVDLENAERSAVERQAHAAFRDHYPWNEKGNSDRFLAIHGADLLYHVTDKRWLVWDGRVFAADESAGKKRGGRAGLGMRVQNYMDDLHVLPKLQKSEEATEEARKFVTRCGTAGHRDAIIRLIQDHRTVLEHDLDPNPHLLCCENGVLDLESGELQPHDRAFRCTQVAGAPYDRDAESGVWLEFLEQTLPDPEVRAFFKLCMGYSLLGSQPEQVFFFIHGKGGTGKSTAIKAIQAAAGSYHRTADFATFLDQGGRSAQGPSPDIARLARARIVTSIEVSGGQKLNDGLLKQLSGGDQVVSRKLFGEETEWAPVMSLWLVANERPKGRVDDDALWRRLLPFKFGEKIGERRDAKLQDRLTRDLEHRMGVLGWMVEGAQEYLGTRSLRPPAAVRALIEDYRSSSNPLTEFYADCCEMGPEYHTERSRLWKAYRAWCGENDSKPIAKSTFFKLVDSDHTIAKVGGLYRCEGIALRNPGAFD